MTSKAMPHDVESISKAGRALRTGDQEPYEFCNRVFPEACPYGKPAPFDQSTSMTFKSLRFSSASLIWMLKALVLPF